MKDVTLSSGWQYGYTYDQDGVRATKVKTYGGMEDSATSYFVENGVMVGECTVRNGSTITSKILYQFDENGQRTGFTYNGTQYYYLYNLQGDVVAVLDSNASIVAKYTYDAWGKVLSVTNASDTVQTSASFIGNINPIRYRGYYYDVETGFYYLQSRYYDPETGRFVNADGLVQTGTGLMDKNMYAYCLDDPVNLVDNTGCDPVPMWAQRILNGTASTVDYMNALSVDPNSWAGSARYKVDRAIRLAEEHNSINVLGYKEHHKKGTANPANRNTHENGQARKQRDNRGEKGDARRSPNPNKRRPQFEVNVIDGEKVVCGVVIVAATAAVVYLVVNDVSVVGVLDDVAIVPLIPVIWDNVAKITS